MTHLQASFVRKTTHINLLIALLYTAFHYIIKKQTPFGDESYSIQIFFQYAHILLVPLMVISLGVLWVSHIKPKLKSSSTFKKRSGLTLLFSLIFLIFSGYFIQLPFPYEKRFIIGAIHTIVGIMWGLLFYWHLTRRRS